MPDAVLDLILPAHLDALAAFRKGELEDAAARLATAAEWERQIGCSAGSLHTLHQSRLITHLKGDLRRAAEYYTDTYRTVSALKNAEGAGLCLRSLGELSLEANNARATATFWRRSAQFRAHSPAEAALIAAWLSVIES